MGDTIWFIIIGIILIVLGLIFIRLGYSVWIKKKINLIIRGYRNCVKIFRCPAVDLPSLLGSFFNGKICYY